MAPPPEIHDDLVSEFLLRLPADDPACLLRASLACQRWRRLLADRDFHRRHRELHPSPRVLGFIHLVFDEELYCSRFVRVDPDSGGPAARDLTPGWIVLDCRHGRALFAAEATGPGPMEHDALDFIVWDPLTNLDTRLPRPSPAPMEHGRNFNAAVLCAADTEACDGHRGCHGDDFRVAFIRSIAVGLNAEGNYAYDISARVYSSVTGSWSDQTFLQSNVSVDFGPCPSVLAGDALYFRGSSRKHAIEYQLTAHRVSVIDAPPPTLFRGNYGISLMSRQGGGLGFAAVEPEPKLCVSLWSRETSPAGVAQWARTRVIEFEILLPDLHHGLKESGCHVVGFAEGTDVLFLSVFSSGPPDIYMVELNSLSIKKVSKDFIDPLFPYTSFCVPVPLAPSADEEPGENSSA